MFLQLNLIKISPLIRGFRTSLIGQNLTQNSNNVVEKLNDKIKSKLFEYMSIYEEAIGLKEIKEAQQTVLDAEKKFVDAQNKRRFLNAELIDIQQKLRSLREELDRLSRTDSKYLKLFTEEHTLLQSELKLVKEYKLKEDEERDLFFFLSASLRDSQEKERARVERIKYLQLGLSILCTTLGILSAYLLNYFRNSNIREILKYDQEEFKNVKELINQVVEKQFVIETNLNKTFDNFEDSEKQKNLIINSMINKINEKEDLNEKLHRQNNLSKFQHLAFASLFLVGFIFYLNK